MTDKELIGYCDLHCESERALFSGAQINRMLELADHPEGFAKAVPLESWISVHDDMKTLCAIARERVQKTGQASGGEACKIIPFPVVGK